MTNADLSEKLADSGWQTLSLTNDFVAYSDSTIPRYRRIGSIVQIEGAVSPISSGTGSTTQIQFATLPTGYCPSMQIYVLCQGSNRAKWLFSITTGGAVSFGRYSDESGWASYSSTVWLPFSVVFLTN